MQEIEENVREWKDYSCSWIKRTNIASFPATQRSE